MNSERDQGGKRSQKEYERRGELDEDDPVDAAILEGLEDLEDMIMDEDDQVDLGGMQSQDEVRMKRAMADDEEP